LYKQLTSKINFEKTYYYSIIILAFTLPLSRASISLFSIFLPLLWALEGNFKEKIVLIKNSSFLLSILALLALILLSVTWASDFSHALKSLREPLYLSLAFVLATAIKKEWINTIITAFLLGMFISEIASYIVYFEIYPLKGKTPDYPSVFMQHIDYSIYLGFTSILILNRLFSKRYSPKEKIVLFMFFVTVSINLFISPGRAGQAAFLVAIFVATIIHFKLSFKSLFIFFIVSFSLFYGAYKTLPNFENRVNQGIVDVQKLQEGEYNTSWGLRAAFWIITYDLLKEDPILGAGTGEYMKVAQVQLEKNTYAQFSEPVKQWCAQHHYHNQYLMIIAQFGLVGLFILILIYVYFFRLKIEDQEIKELSILFATIFLVGYMAEPLLAKQFTLVLFAFYSGLFVAATKKTI